MKLTRNPSARASVYEDARNRKAFGLELAVTDHDLMAKIKAAFELAKGGGRELDLTFSARRNPAPDPAGLEPSPPVGVGAGDLEPSPMTWPAPSAVEEDRDAVEAGLVLAGH